MAGMTCRRAYKRTKVTKFRFRDLPHTCGSYLRMAGENQRASQELCGRKDFRMTLMYTQRSGPHTHHAIEGLEGVMGQGPC